VRFGVDRPKRKPTEFQHASESTRSSKEVVEDQNHFSIDSGNDEQSRVSSGFLQLGGGESAPSVLDDRLRVMEEPTEQTSAASERDRSPPIEIKLDSRITSGLIRDRHDILLTGEVATDQPIETISLVVGAQVRAFYLYGRGERGRQIFMLTLAQRISADARSTSFEIVAKTQTGGQGHASFQIDAETNNFQGVRLVEGPICVLAPQERALIPILLYVEKAAVDLNRVLHVEGWSTGLNQIVTVQVLIGERRFVVDQSCQIRDDIASVYPGYPNARLSGFRLSEALSGGDLPDSVSVEVIDLQGSMSCATVPVEFGVVPGPNLSEAESRGDLSPDLRREIFVHCDKAILYSDGGLHISGWAVCATAIATVAVYLDSKLIGISELGLQRPDVAQEYQEIPLALYSGFEFRHQQTGTVAGDHEIELRTRNGLDDTHRLLLTVSATAHLSDFPRHSPAASVGSSEFMFQLDHPLVIDGKVPTPVTGRLVIEGWALARSGIEAIKVLLDGRHLGQAYYGTPRRDVEEALFDWNDAFRSGYIFHCPPRALESGMHSISVELKAKNGDIFNFDFVIEVQQSDDGEDYATIRRHMVRAEIDLYQDVLGRLTCQPSFRLFLLAHSPLSPERFDATLQSLNKQAYRDWRLVLITDAEDPSDLLAMVARAGMRHQVSVMSTLTASSPLLALSAPDSLTGVLFLGDVLGSDALAEFAVARGLHPEVDFFYADEDRISPSSGSREPFFKPAWSPDLLLSTNYIGRLWVAASDLLAKAGISPQSLLAHQGDYDAVLRCTELTHRIHHIPKLLLRRAEYSIDAGDERRVLEATVARRGIQAKLLPGCVPGTWRLKRTAPVDGMVSIIIPTCAAKGYVAKCLETLRSRTAYRNFELICIDNIPMDQPDWKNIVRNGADLVVDIPGQFNWSRFNNLAAEQAKGEYLLFLNDDVEVQREDWLDALLEHAQRPEVGVVGPQLLYPDRKVQHAGIFLTTLGAGRHSFRFLPEDDPGYFGLALTQRNVIAVTGACMLMRRDVFERIGRFDEAHEVVNNDVDCCLRAWQMGLAVVYTPHSQLIHHELASRANMKDDFDSDHFATQWRTLYATGDPYFSPRLSKFADEYSPDAEPTRAICASRPLFDKEAIRRILVVKLDHIGDLITALPAIRRLRHHFPMARIHLLASGAAKMLVDGENCIDELIEFEFFHARSGQGQKGITEQDLLALGNRLAPYDFDLAMDLRKQLETRHVLKHVPSRFRAGYNHLGRFPWLDVTLEWEGDNQLHRKRSHVSDDLVRLVDAVATASERHSTTLQVGIGDENLPAGLPAAARKLFRKPVVAVHPGVGAIMRQWMPRYFATVIDLLIEKNHVHVVLVGGRDEAKLAEDVLGHVVNRGRVVSVAGRTSLGELKNVLSACILYLGNNSGPQHIAAALGLPTIGIYSGVVDAAEWGPTGPRAIALQRNMICSPCYLVKPEECVRDMACLKRLEPAVVHQYCEMMLARVVPTIAMMTSSTTRSEGATRTSGRPTRKSLGSLSGPPVGRITSAGSLTEGALKVTRVRRSKKSPRLGKENPSPLDVGGKELQIGRGKRDLNG
jgi:ADP-heptose:LPS heptosyltransferase/GT2 family glycosyltransferase